MTYGYLHKGTEVFSFYHNSHDDGFFEDERRIGKNIFVYYEILEALEEI